MRNKMTDTYFKTKRRKNGAKNLQSSLFLHLNLTALSVFSCRMASCRIIFTAMEHM